MADAQVPWGLWALSESISEPAWKSKPSWYLVATEDRMIAGATVVEVAASHAVYVSQPAAVANLIIQAANEAVAHAG